LEEELGKKDVLRPVSAVVNGRGSRQAGRQAPVPVTCDSGHSPVYRVRQVVGPSSHSHISIKPGCKLVVRIAVEPL
jgi:hypothetical protein